MKIWTVLGLAAVIWFMGMVTGIFNSRMAVALFFFVILGAIVPPFAIGIGFVVVLYLLLVRGQKVIDWITSKLGGKTP